MKTIISIIDKLNTLGLCAASASLFLLILIATVEMLTRFFLNSSLGFASEFSGYLVAFSFFSGSGWALGQGGHIRVDLLTERLSPSQAKGLEIFAGLVGLIVASALTYGLLVWTMGTFERGSVSYFKTETPLWIPQLIFSLGTLFLTLGLLKKVLLNITGKGVN